MPGELWQAVASCQPSSGFVLHQEAFFMAVLCSGCHVWQQCAVAGWPRDGNCLLPWQLATPESQPPAQAGGGQFNSQDGRARALGG